LPNAIKFRPNGEISPNLVNLKGTYIGTWARVAGSNVSTKMHCFTLCAIRELIFEEVSFDRASVFFT
jgi:hypothetical protein